MVEQNSANPESDDASAQTEAGERRGALGPLELRLMSALWNANDPLAGQEIVDALGPGRNYKTVMTVLNRLVAKGLLERRLNGRAYRYEPRLRRGDFLRSAADELVRNYLASYGDDAATSLADAISACAPHPRAVAPPQEPAPTEKPPAIPHPHAPGTARPERTLIVAFVLAALGIQAAMLLVSLARRGAR